MGDWVLAPAGIAVGIVNAVAGGGSLVSFPLFLLLGYSPLVANVSNSVGVVASNVGGVWGYREQLRASKALVAKLAAAVTGGALIGAVILLTTGEAVFEAIVPWVIVVASLLMLAQPYVVARIKRRNIALDRSHDTVHTPSLLAASFVVGIYGGYFGPGQGVLLMAVFGALMPIGLQQVNGLKNASVFSCNILCLIVFALFAHIAWGAALYMTAGTLIGGFVGTHFAKKLPDKAFRYAVVAVGFGAAAYVALT